MFIEPRVKWFIKCASISDIPSRCNEHSQMYVLHNLTLNSYNISCNKFFDEFTDFVALHYALSNRDDTKYWRDVSEKSLQSMQRQVILSKIYLPDMTRQRE